jgi:hypothetical protein
LRQNAYLNRGVGCSYSRTPFERLSRYGFRTNGQKVIRKLPALLSLGLEPPV